MILELIQANPIPGIIVISFVVSLFTTLVNYFIVDKKLMQEIKEKQKNIKEEMKRHKDNPDKMMELNKQMMEHLPAQMKQTFKIMIVTFIPLLVIFWWMRSTFLTTTLATSWIWWYIGSSIIFSMVLRKLFKLD